MKTGRPLTFPPCPDCQQPIRSAHSPYYRCGCRGYIVRAGKLCPTKRRPARAGTKKVAAKLQQQGPVEQFRKPMAWWEFEAMQEAE